jgi:hypothetical protein
MEMALLLAAAPGRIMLPCWPAAIIASRLLWVPAAAVPAAAVPAAAVPAAAVPAAAAAQQMRGLD